MKRYSCVLITLAAALILPRVGRSAESPKLVPVAEYINRTEIRETVGARVSAILQAHGIQSVSAASFSATVAVPADRAAEARRLLATAIRAEKLQLSLLDAEGNRFVVV